MPTRLVDGLGRRETPYAMRNLPQKLGPPLLISDLRIRLFNFNIISLHNKDAIGGYKTKLLYTYSNIFTFSLLKSVLEFMLTKSPSNYFIPSYEGFFPSNIEYTYIEDNFHSPFILANLGLSFSY